MFLVGVEFRTELFRSRAKSAAAVSITGMLVPFLCAAALAPWLITVPGLFSEKAKLLEAALFSIMVLMALVTTPMATPLFEWVYGRPARKAGELGAATAGV